MDREPREHKRDKQRCPCEARSAYLFPNISCCSSGLPSRSALRGLYSRGPLLEATMPLRDASFLISGILFQPYISVVCWSGICGLGSIEVGSLGPINTLPFDHKSGSPDSQSDLLPDINKPPI